MTGTQRQDAQSYMSQTSTIEVHRQGRASRPSFWPDSGGEDYAITPTVAGHMDGHSHRRRPRDLRVRSNCHPYGPSRGE
jgi:hypothetical protein